MGSDVHPREGHEPRKRGERPPPTVRHGRQSDHRQGGRDRRVSGWEAEVAFFNTSEEDVIDDARRAIPADEPLDAFADTQAAVPPIPIASARRGRLRA